MLLTRIWMFNKRLLKKPSFLIVLILIPLSVLMLRFSVTGAEGMLTVAVSCDDGGDAVYNEILADLGSKGGLIEIVAVENREAAVSMVRSGKADAAWLFPAEISENLREYSIDPTEDNAVVEVVQREESVLMQLSREKLMSAIFPHLSYSFYSEFVLMRFPELSDTSDENLRLYYDSVDAKGDELFKVENVSGAGDAEQQGYLLSPVRGLLAVIVVVGGLAVSMLWLKDKSDGVFDTVPEKKRYFHSVAYCFVAVLDLALASAVSPSLAGLGLSFGREVLLALLLAVHTVGFCVFIRTLCGKNELLGPVIPVVAVGCIALSPVFFDVNIVPALQYLLPTYGYLTSAYSANAVLWSLVSCAFLYGASYVLHRIDLSFRLQKLYKN